MSRMTLSRFFDYTHPLTYQQFTQAINALVLLRRQATTGTVPKPQFGICNNWVANLPEHVNSAVNPYNLVQYLAMDWPHSAEPGEPSCTPINEIAGQDLWEEDNLRLRLDLIDFMLKRLRTYKKQLRVQTERASPHR